MSNKVDKLETAIGQLRLLQTLYQNHSSLYDGMTRAQLKQNDEEIQESIDFLESLTNEEDLDPITIQKLNQE
jgi:hypothetical protein